MLAYAFPYRRFAAALAGVRARLRVDADRYSLIVSDFHRLLLAGLPGALRKISLEVFFRTDVIDGHSLLNCPAVNTPIVRDPGHFLA